MTLRHLEFPLPGGTAATLNLPEQITGESIRHLEAAITRTMAAFRRDLGDRDSDRGAVEYNSWLARLKTAAA